MLNPEHRGSEQRPRLLAQTERDAAIQRVSRVRRWVIGGATALTAAFAAIVSAVAPGHTLGPRSYPRIASSPGGSARAVGAGARASGPATAAARMPAPASPGELGLQTPSQAPQAAIGGPQASPDQSQAQAAPEPQPSPSTQPAPQPSAQASNGSGAVVSGGS